MSKHLVYLALGSNLGNREANLKLALQKLPPVVEMVAVSRLYATAPAYVLDQPAFLNIAVKGRTNLSPLALLAYLKEIEADMGRQKTVRYGPRIIDVDIVFYNDTVFNRPDLQIPHLRMTERGFVLRPLADIAAEVVHPVLKKTVAELLAALPAADGILTVTDWKQSP
jgi:2-amino-4-hydroxy-6-hydroxymethyldihydropteridine diphosphokinase